MQHSILLPRTSIAAAVCAAFLLAACGSDTTPFDIPAAPAGVGHADTAATADAATVPAYVDAAATNQRNNPCYVTKETNAGVRVLDGFLALWTPSSLLVDAGVTLAAANGCAAVTASTWTGIPGDATDGHATDATGATVLAANIQYVVNATSARTSDQATAAYLDDRRNKGYSVTDGMGPLTSAWRAAAQQTTTITSVPSDATTVLYSDGGNNLGVGSATNSTFGTVVDFIGSLSNNGSTEPAKRYYKYARPWRWSGSVSVVPALVPAESTTPATDGGFPSGHAAEAMRDGLAMAYVVPERFQEMLSRALELGENRIFAGMHSPLDVMAGRIQAQAVVASNIYAATAAARQAAVTQAHTALMAAAGVTDLQSFNAYAHSATTSTDRFADHATNKTGYLRRATYGFTQIASATQAVVVPKGAEVLLETRLPYLDATQRRVVLKTTALASGYPIMDDAEGWGRLNLFAAADGYAAFNGDVTVTMDASLGGFNAADAWRNDITGAGVLTKLGSGSLTLAGANTWNGGAIVAAGVLEADSNSAFGTGDVYVSSGTVVDNAPGQLAIGGKFTQRSAGTLELHLGANGQGSVAAAGKVTIEGGALKLKFVQGYVPAVGTVIDVLTGASRQGAFASVSADGHSVTPLYSGAVVRVRIDS